MHYEEHLEEESIKSLKTRIKKFTQKIFSSGQKGEDTYKELHDINNEIHDINKKKTKLDWLYSEPILKSFRCLLLSDDVNPTSVPLGKDHQTRTPRCSPSKRTGCKTQSKRK